MADLVDRRADAHHVRRHQRVARLVGRRPADLFRDADGGHRSASPRAALAIAAQRRPSRRPTRTSFPRPSRRTAASRSPRRRAGRTHGHRRSSAADGGALAACSPTVRSTRPRRRSRPTDAGWRSNRTSPAAPRSSLRDLADGRRVAVSQRRRHAPALERRRPRRLLRRRPPPDARRDRSGARAARSRRRTSRSIAPARASLAVTPSGPRPRSRSSPRPAAIDRDRRPAVAARTAAAAPAARHGAAIEADLPLMHSCWHCSSLLAAAVGRSSGRLSSPRLAKTSGGRVGVFAQRDRIATTSPGSPRPSASRCRASTSCRS